MRLILLVLCGLLLAFPAVAEEADDAALYQVTDVPVDVSDASAAQVRDAAVAQGTRIAFGMLLARLGVDAKLGDKQKDEALAESVQAFEVQQEKLSAKHYVGVMTFHFKPAVVRSMLGKAGASFVEARSKTYVILPLVMLAGKTVLFEESTKWHDAWEEAVRSASTVPLALPAPEDIATKDAVALDAGALAALIGKYKAAGVLVATLTAEPDPATHQNVLVATTQLVEADGKVLSPQKRAPIATDVTHYASALVTEARAIKGELENGWKQTTTKLAKGPQGHLSVVAVVPTIPAWGAMKQKIEALPVLKKLTVDAMMRGAVRVTLDFHGSNEELQTALGSAGMSLAQKADGSWEIKDR